MKSKKSRVSFFEKTVYTQIFVLALLMAAVYFIKPSLNFSDSKITNLATLVINFETQKRVFEGEVVKDMTILDALNMAVSVGKLNFNYVLSESGYVKISQIDGYANGTNNKYFAFYLNSKKVYSEDLNRVIIRGGDSIEIRNE